MKKFISMVMAAAMVVSLVPATAFAAGDVTATAKVVDVVEWSEADAKNAKEFKDGYRLPAAESAELQLKIKEASYRDTDEGKTITTDITLTLDGAVWNAGDGVAAEADKAVSADMLKLMGTIVPDNGTTKNFADAGVKAVYEDDNEVKFTFTGKFAEDDVIAFNFPILIDSIKAGHEVTVDVDSKICDAEDMVILTVQEEGIKATCKDTVDVAVEETTNLKKDLKIETTVGEFAKDQVIELKLNNGFEWVEKDIKTEGAKYTVDKDESDEKVLVLVVTEATDEIVVKAGDVKIEATTAKEGDVATVTVKAKDNLKKGGSFAATAEAVEVAKVVGEGLTISVDEDEDIPEMWSGVEVDTKYLTDDDDNDALTITIEESVAGAFSEKDTLELKLPEGVWVVDAKMTQEAGNPKKANDWEKLLADAYREGDHQSFMFKKRTISETDAKAYELELDMKLVADPGFVGDVVVEMLVDGESVGEVTVATFKAPYTVEAQANDLIIDYRNTKVPTDIVVKEAEAGLWAKDNFEVSFGIEKFENDCFEDDMVYTVNEESEMEIDGDDKVLSFVVDKESDDEAAVVTISNISLYMSRNMPAGSYDLTIDGDMFDAYKAQTLFAPDCKNDACKGATNLDATKGTVCKKDNDCIIDDVCDYSDVVKEGFVNIITAGRDKDDASFTKKVVVPVGESYIVAGEETVALDVPAYVSAAGYTMLPVRAVAVALGIHTNNVLWDQATKTVTILYGQRIITMTVGSKVINVNGSPIPASASPEVVDGRTFLPMRDLATALGVTDITWDAATKTATLNGNK